MSFTQKNEWTVFALTFMAIPVLAIGGCFCLLKGGVILGPDVLFAGFLKRFLWPTISAYVLQDQALRDRKAAAFFFYLALFVQFLFQLLLLLLLLLKFTHRGGVWIRHDVLLMLMTVCVDMGLLHELFSIGPPEKESIRLWAVPLMLFILSFTAFQFQ